MNWLVILLIVVVVLSLGGLPIWPHSQAWGVGYWPSGFGLVLIILLIIILARGV